MSTTYIEDLVTHEKFNLKDAANINIMYGNYKNYKTIGKGIWEYSLIFDRIAEDTRNINIIEPNGWAYKDIVLKPYGDENTFIFEDKPEGQGTLITTDGDKIVGAFKNGLPNGRCTIYSEKFGGTVYCNMVDNKMDGEVIIQYKTGNTQRATFANGRQITNWK